MEEAIQLGLVSGSKKGEKGTSWDVAPLKQYLEQLHSGNSLLKVPIVERLEGYVVVDKPAGMHGHPIHLTDKDTLTHWAFWNFPFTQNEFPNPQPTLVPHRLDYGTSGLQIVALTKRAYELWRERFTKKQVRKSYLAWCWGVPKVKCFELNFGLAHLASDSTRMGVPALGDKTRGETHSAQSLCKVIEMKADRFLVEVECFTGVTHQVRAHLAAAKFPLLGDSVYDPEYKKRGGEFSHHLLRAVKLFFSDEESFSLQLRF